MKVLLSAYVEGGDIWVITDETTQILPNKNK